MSRITPSQQKHFDDLYELYHFNPFHDRMGRFASSSSGARSYVDSSGRPTDKARRRLNFAEYDPDTDSQGGKKKGKKNKKKDKQKAEKADPKKTYLPSTEEDAKKMREEDSDDNGNDNDSGNGGGGKKDKKKDTIQLDRFGRIAEKDQNKAIHQIENEISKDWSNKSKALNDSSRLLNDIGKFRERNRTRTAKAKAAAEDISNMSNDELKRYVDERTERMRLEQRYREIKEADYNRGRAKLDDFLETAGTVLALGATAATIAATIHTLRS